MAKEPAFINLGRHIREYPIAAGQDFEEGYVVALNGDGQVVEAASPPTAILGVSLHEAGADPDPDTVSVGVATADTTYFFEGDRLPVETDVGETYGLSKDADGDWQVDTAVGAHVVVEKVDLTRRLFEVKIDPELRTLG
jgi:hypothetical protein